MMKKQRLFRKNIFSDLSSRVSKEVVKSLVEHPSVKIKRIVSTGQSSPLDFWYDQDESEWVMVLQGKAVLQFEGCSPSMTLGAGDFINIPAHQKHRVEWTDPNTETVWLAVFY